MKLNTQYAVDATLKLLSIDSPTGYTRNATDHLLAVLGEMGFSPVRTRKGAVLCPLGGEGHPLVLAAHTDTLGLMVRAIKANGRLAFTRLGGPNFQAIETENVTVITRAGTRHTGVVELKTPPPMSMPISTPKSAMTARWKSCWMKTYPPVRMWKSWASPWGILCASIPAHA